MSKKSSIDSSRLSSIQTQLGQINDELAALCADASADPQQVELGEVHRQVEVCLRRLDKLMHELRNK